jgi:hypothetical protein
MFSLIKIIENRKNINLLVELTIIKIFKIRILSVLQISVKDLRFLKLIKIKILMARVKIKDYLHKLQNHKDKIKNIVQNVEVSMLWLPLIELLQ